MRKLYNHWATGLIVVAAVIGLIFGGVYAFAQNTPALAFASESEDGENEYGFFDDDESEEHEDGDSEGEEDEDDDFEGGEGFGGIFATVGIIGLATVGIAVVFPWLRSRFTSSGTAPPTE